MSIGHLYVLFGEMPIQVLCQFFNWVFFFLVLSIVSSLYILDINPLPDVSVNVFSHSVGCLFAAVFLCCAKTFYFDVVPFAYCFPLFPFPGEMYQKKYTMSNVGDFTA